MEKSHTAAKIVFYVEILKNLRSVNKIRRLKTLFFLIPKPSIRNFQLVLKGVGFQIRHNGLRLAFFISLVGIIFNRIDFLFYFQK